ncbi:MAG: hypothetical protein JKY37_01135 [Nannocystaceae bacterium]|nr:hypothetical protein [Nannocystaceae bacterium]
MTRAKPTRNDLEAVPRRGLGALLWPPTVTMLPRVSFALLALLSPLPVGLAACGEPSNAESTSCDTVIWGRAHRSGASLSVIGSWDDWTTPVAMARFSKDPGWQLAHLELAAGDYGYLVLEEGAGRIDAFNGLTTFRDSDAQEVSLLRVAGCEQPRAVVVSATRVDPFALDLRLEFTRSAAGAAIDLDSIQATDLDGVVTVLSSAADEMDSEANSATVRVRLGTPGKHTFALSFQDGDAVATPPVTVAAWADPVAPTWQDGIVYQVVVDRFAGDDGAALDKPVTPGSRAGGTLGGVTAALRDGTFAALGVSALWLSPVYVNPIEARAGRADDHMYEGYHGYWPLASRGVEPRIGGEAALHELVAEAHAQGVRVLLDLVPNHLYEDNPRVAQGRAEGWFHEHDTPCVCGSASCPWSSFILTCWFTDYLPDLRFENAAVMSMVVEDAVWWQQTFDTDGFRIDAVPMMPRAATRRIAHALREVTAPRDSAFTIGEIFTGSGRGGTEGLRYYLGPDGLDSAFDFPLMWALRDVVAHGTGSFASIESSLAYTEAALAGSGAEMQLGRMIGNHDVTRFASESAGDATRDGWDDPPPQSSTAHVYARQRLALGLVLTLPGLPVLYYGDELGLAGASDPDNRRVMPAGSALSPEQSALLMSVRRLAQLRRCVPALRRGSRRGLLATDQHFAFVRDWGDGAPAVIVASNAAVETVVVVPLAGVVPAGRYVDALGAAALEVGEGATEVVSPALGLAVYLPAGHVCL